MSQPYSRRGLLGTLAAAVLGLFFGKRAKATSAPKPPTLPPVDLGSTFRCPSDSYDSCGRLTAVSDPLGSVTTFVYDSAGNFIRCINPGDPGEASGNACDQKS